MTPTTKEAAIMRNPIHQALVRSRLMARISADFHRTEVGEAALGAYQNEYDVVRSLLGRGLISTQQFSDIHEAIKRPIAAAALRHFRRQTKIAQRRSINRAANEAATHPGRF